MNLANSLGSAVESRESMQLPKDASSPEDFLELIQRRFEEQVRTRVEHALRWRYTWLGSVILFATGTLMTLTVRDSLSQARLDLGVARQTQVDAAARMAQA